MIQLYGYFLVPTVNVNRKLEFPDPNVSLITSDSTPTIIVLDRHHSASSIPSPDDNKDEKFNFKKLEGATAVQRFA